MTLAQETCTPCQAGGNPLPGAEAGYLARGVPLWTLAESRIERNFKFKDFTAAMAFVNRVADAANGQGHHPDIFVSYNRVRLTLTTHKIGGLSRNDFILASRIDELADVKD
jgi:4a-hydroxytetrahydrobiopterin dehydratase